MVCPVKKLKYYQSSDFCQLILNHNIGTKYDNFLWLFRINGSFLNFGVMIHIFKSITGEKEEKS